MPMYLPPNYYKFLRQLQRQWSAAFLRRLVDVKSLLDDQFLSFDARSASRFSIF